MGKRGNEEMEWKWSSGTLGCRGCAIAGQCRELYVLNFSDAGYLLDSCVHGVCVCVCVCVSWHLSQHVSVVMALFTSTFSVKL